VAGGGAALIVWMIAKRELEQQFGSGAEALQRSLQRRGGVLAEQTRSLCSRVAEQAIRNELASLGFTPALIRDSARTATHLNQLASEAARLGVSIETALSRLRAIG